MATSRPMCGESAVASRQPQVCAAPKLYDDEPINTFFGQSDGMPPFVLVRAHSRVAAVTVHSDSGEEYRLDLSATDDEFGLKFAAGPLRDGEHPVSFVAHLGDGNDWQREVRMST